MVGLAPGLGPVDGYPWPIARVRGRIALVGECLLLHVLKDVALGGRDPLIT